MRFLILAPLCAMSLVGCAGAINHELQRASARAIAPTPYPDSVTISQMQRDRLGNVRKWVATTRSGVFDCSIESDERVALCAKRGAER